MLYVETMSWNVAGQVIWPVLAKNDLGQTSFVQDFQCRVYWSPIGHKTALECLNSARERIPNAQLVLSEDETKILIIEDDRACELYRITKDTEA